MEQVVATPIPTKVAIAVTQGQNWWVLRNRASILTKVQTTEVRPINSRWASQMSLRAKALIWWLALTWAIWICRQFRVFCTNLETRLILLSRYKSRLFKVYSMRCSLPQLSLPKRVRTLKIIWRMRGLYRSQLSSWEVTPIFSTVLRLRTVDHSSKDRVVRLSKWTRICISSITKLPSKNMHQPQLHISSTTSNRCSINNLKVICSNLSKQGEVQVPMPNSKLHNPCCRAYSLLRVLLL